MALIQVNYLDWSVLNAKLQYEIPVGMDIPLLIKDYNEYLVSGSYLDQTDFAGKTVAPFWTDQGGPGDYREAFTAAAHNAARITDFLQLTNTPTISDSDMSARLDAWLATVNQ